VALITFSSDPKLEWRLGAINTVPDLLAATENITYSGGGTVTSDALELMRREGFDG